MRHIYYYGMLKGSTRNRKTELKRMSEDTNPINRLEELDTALVEVKARINELNHASILTTRDLEVSESAIDQMSTEELAAIRAHIRGKSDE